ncbi:Origin recognition complex subunit 3 [Emydomyces testavorans]|uniref:Origin recognition complex subunit 3 n=1 Tax=Emydomyces testavorans TaxID=2070801 RepID=A0AAF0DH70_9EURO|nr:Origin recognition complex subunit 3 [Emydomyces testavorans]
MPQGHYFGKGNTEGHDGLEHQSVYIYKPAGNPKTDDQQLRKRRKLTHVSEEHTQNEELPFVPLLDGKEDATLVKHRYAAFKNFWSGQSQRIQRILHEVDSMAVVNLTEFVKQATPENCEGRIPCGMITLGSNISSISGLLDRLRERVQGDGIADVAVLESGDASNLKNVLKTLIRTILANMEGEAADVDFRSDRLGPKLLAYDLELLHGYVQQNKGQKIVVVFKDSEAFDHGVMSDLISLLWSWHDRIPLVLLFGVATSVDLLEARLPRSTVNMLHGKCFDIRDPGDSVKRIFLELETHPDSTLWLGHGVSKLLLERSEDHFQNPERFGSSLKYTYMTHFFANPLAVLLSEGICETDFQPELCEAVRNIPSFHRGVLMRESHAQTLLEDGNSAAVQKLLDDNKFLAREALKYVKKGQEMTRRICSCLESLKVVLESVKTIKAPSLSDLVILALGGKLYASKIIGDMLSAINKLRSDSFESLLAALVGVFPSADDLLDELRTLLAAKKGSELLRTRYDDSRVTHKTTLVAQRLKLSKAKAKLSEEETKYTKIVDHLHMAFRQYLLNSLIDPTDLFMHEVFLYDFRSPVRDTFTPRPRFIVERALSSPSDYLAFDSDTIFGNLSASQPATALVYQLYLESGALVNIYDLWRAYYAITGGEDDENCDERAALTLFYRAVSELKMMGMVKPSRRKTDHLAKLSWMGL